MKLSLLLMMSLPVAFYAQDKTTANSSQTYPNTYSSGSANVQKFDSKAKRFNDWSISAGVGPAFMAHADLTSFYDGKIDWGWNAYASLDKQITHTFGLSLQYQMGKTTQRGRLPGVEGDLAGVAQGWTKYNQLSLLGDINFSNLLRRVDNHSNFRWALHGYAGIGIQSYDTYLTDHNLLLDQPPKRPAMTLHQKFDFSSVFYQGGVGLQYKVSRLLDLELRGMYMISGDDEFDAGGDYSFPVFPPGSGHPQVDPRIAYNEINDRKSDNAFTVTLGVSIKLGKHLSHLRWHDPLQEAYYRANLLESTQKDFVVCEKGDLDNDGVCDDWDRQLDTPAGARVDGAGVALDMDLDGVIDLYDKCVTVPGPPENDGCPITEPAKMSNDAAVSEINQNFEGIEFELNSDKIRPTSYAKLDKAAEIIQTLNQADKFLVVGATDARGSDAYNLKLSQRRAEAVVNYLANHGVNKNMLTADGRGKHDLKYPECDPATKCPEWKNEANRRVYFIQK